jgi:hypothetical protein
VTAANDPSWSRSWTAASSASTGSQSPGGHRQRSSNACNPTCTRTTPWSTSCGSNRRTADGRGIHLDTLRLRAFPFADEVVDFVTEHDQVFIVEQNRDAQLRLLIMNECAIDPARLVPVLHYDGTPITARFIGEAIRNHLSQGAVAPFERAVS